MLLNKRNEEQKVQSHIVPDAFYNIEFAARNSKAPCLLCFAENKVMIPCRNNEYHIHV